jgi:uncharacterized phage infection (PIP) family protein YhgE
MVARTSIIVLTMIVAVAATALSQSQTINPTIASLQAQVTAQAQQIRRLQSRVAALEIKSSPTASAMRSRVAGVREGLPIHRPLPGPQMKLAPMHLKPVKLIDLQPRLEQLESRRTKFLKSLPPSPSPVHHTPAPPPTIAQLAAEVNQLSAEYAALTTELSWTNAFLGAYNSQLEGSIENISQNLNSVQAGMNTLQQTFQAHTHQYENVSPAIGIDSIPNLDCNGSGSCYPVSDFPTVTVLTYTGRNAITANTSGPISGP